MSIDFMPLHKEHLPLLQHWFNLPHVQAFYSLRPWTFEDIKQKFIPYINRQQPIDAFITYMDKVPMGYIQKYAVKEYPWPDQDLSSEMISQAAGLDFLIGPAEMCGKGYGSMFVHAFLLQHIWPNFQWCIVDPDIRNSASVKLFKRCGFQMHKPIATTDTLGKPVTLQLMICEKPKVL